MPHVTYDWSFARMLICLKARSVQAFIASSACKCTNILFYLINLYLGMLENQKRLLFSLERFQLRGLILQGQFLSFCPNLCLLYIHTNRFHYQDYLSGCKDKGIEPKAWPPTHFKSDDRLIFMLSLLPWCLVLCFPGHRQRLTLLPLLWRNHLLLWRPAWRNFYWSLLQMPIWWVIIYQLDKIFVSQSQLAISIYQTWIFSPHPAIPLSNT